MSDARRTHPYAVIGVGNGHEVTWQVVRMHDLAVAGFGRNIITDDGVRIEMPIRRTWAAVHSAQTFADNLGSNDPDFQLVDPLVWIRAGTSEVVK
jgi:hypothetical protein